MLTIADRTAQRITLEQRLELDHILVEGTLRIAPEERGHGVPQGAATSPLAADVSAYRYDLGVNPQGITSVQIKWSDTDPVLTFQDADGPHAIPVGIGHWVRARTGFKKHINELYDTPDQGVAARGAWSAEDTFSARMVLTDTPYTVITSFKFTDNQVALDVAYNIRWDVNHMTEPQVVGTR